MFQVIQPAGLLAPYVKQYWLLRMEHTQVSQRLVPFGCAGLFFHRSSPLRSGCFMPESGLVGQSTSYVNLAYSGVVDFIAIIFQPAGAMAFFKIPMSEFFNRNILIDALGDPQVRELEKYLADMPGNETCVRLIESFLLKRISSFSEYNFNRLHAVIDSVSHGQQDISALARTACLGYKQFKRIFTEHIGANPKDFLRIARFQKASYVLQQARPRITLTQLADECGYYDKSHLIRELKELSGYTPGEFLAVCDPYSEYHSLFRSALVDVREIENSKEYGLEKEL